MLPGISQRQRRRRRVVAWIAACCLWLQSTIAGACGAHDAGHDRAALAPNAASASIDAQPAHSHHADATHEHERAHDHGDPDPAGMHAMLHAMHCACPHGAAAIAPDLPMVGLTGADRWVRYTPHLPAPISTSRLLRPPIAA